MVFRTIVFHFLCILIFAGLYYYFGEGFESDYKGNKLQPLDFFLLSTTVQAGVGIADINPRSSASKLIMIIQQFMMISTHVFMIYVFTL